MWKITTKNDYQLEGVIQRKEIMRSCRITLIMFTVLVMTLFLVGCGGGEEPAEQQTGQEQTTEEEIAETEEVTEETEAEESPGSSAEQAIPIEPGVVEASLEEEEDEEWYVFELPAGGIMELTFSPGENTQRMNVSILDHDLNLIDEEWDVKPPSSRDFSHVIPAGEPEDFYIVVSQGEPGNYTFDLGVSLQNDAETAGDAPGTAVEAVEVAAEGTVNGMVADEDDSDWYTFDLQPGEVFDLQFTPGDDCERLNVTLLDEEQNTEWEKWDVAPGVTMSYTLQLGAEGGIWYVSVSQGSNGQYTLNMSTSPQNDAGMETDAGDRAVDAMPVDTLDVVEGRVAGHDEDDFYTLQVEEGETFSLAAATGEAAERLNYAVLDPQQNVIWEKWDLPAGETCQFTLPEGSPAGPYYLQVSLGIDGNYTLEIR